MLLPKEDREERAIGTFLEYYNRSNRTAYQIKEWLDRLPRIRKEPKGRVPDCLCVDTVSGSEMVIERIMLTGERDLKSYQEAGKFLADVRERLTCRLPGVFLLHDWGGKGITFTGAKERAAKIAQLCQAILEVAPTLAEGEEAPLSQPFPVKIRREKTSRMNTNCALVWHHPEEKHPTSGNRLDRQFGQVLNEANDKFANYADKETVLLINIWETERDYQMFETELFQGIDMRKHSNIKHIYLSEGWSDLRIYQLWSR